MSYKSLADYVQQEVLEGFRGKAATKSRVMTAIKLQAIMVEFIMRVEDDFVQRMTTSADDLSYPKPSEKHGTNSRPHSFAQEVGDGPPQVPEGYAEEFYANNLKYPVQFHDLAAKHRPEIDWMVGVVKGFMPQRIESKNPVKSLANAQKEAAKKQSFWQKFLQDFALAFTESTLKHAKQRNTNLGATEGGKQVVRNLERQIEMQRQVEKYHQRENVALAMEFIRDANEIGKNIIAPAEALAVRAMLLAQVKLSILTMQQICKGMSLAIEPVIYALAIKTDDSARRQRTRKTSRRNS